MESVDQFVAVLRGVLDRVGVEGALFSNVEARRQQEVVWFLWCDRVNWWRWLTGSPSSTIVIDSRIGSRWLWSSSSEAGATRLRRGPAFSQQAERPWVRLGGATSATWCVHVRDT